MTADEWVSASEVGTYEYCARAYWLERVHAIEGYDPSLARLEVGVAQHNAHGRRVVLQQWLVRAAILFLVGAGILVWLGGAA